MLRQRSRNRLEVFCAILRPLRIQVQPAALKVQVISGEVAEFTHTQTGQKRCFQQQFPMRRTGIQEAAYLIGAQSTTGGLGSSVEGRHTFQRIRGEIAALDAPVTECTQGFGVICEGLACPSLALEVSQFLLYSRQDAIQVSKGNESQSILPGGGWGSSSH